MVNSVPALGSHVTETFPELSETVRSSHVTFAVGFRTSVLFAWSSMQITFGGSISINTKTWEIVFENN